MKRYIRSDANSDRLAFYKNGEIWHLPTWYADRSDAELDEIKKSVIDDVFRPHTDDRPIQINESQVRRDLRKEGFNTAEIEEIFAMIYSGMTLDGAIQRELMLHLQRLSNSEKN